VGNAVKFTERGFVKIAATWETNLEDRRRVHLIFEVSDSGVGIPPQRQSVIFEPFVQADAARDAERQGTGLGLSIVKRLTEAMGGTVGVESTVGRGSTFRVHFPDVEISAKLPISDRQADDKDVNFDDFLPARILVVDDNATNRDLIAGMFSRSQHTLFFAENGREAVDMMVREKPEIVFMDVRMPSMDGREALLEIRQRQGFEVLPVIALTASSLLDEENVMRRTFSGYIRKPFGRRQIYDELIHYLPKQGSIIAPESAPANGTALPDAPPVAPLGPAEATRLHRDLQRLLKDRWPNVRDSLAIGETTAFAREVSAIAAGDPALEEYGRDLERYAQTFSLIELERKVDQFPKLVEAATQSKS